MSIYRSSVSHIFADNYIASESGSDAVFLFVWLLMG